MLTTVLMDQDDESRKTKIKKRGKRRGKENQSWEKKRNPGNEGVKQDGRMRRRASDRLLRSKEAASLGLCSFSARSRQKSNKAIKATEASSRCCCRQGRIRKRSRALVTGTGLWTLLRLLLRAVVETQSGVGFVLWVGAVLLSPCGVYLCTVYGLHGERSGSGAP